MESVSKENAGSVKYASVRQGQRVSSARFSLRSIIFGARFLLAFYSTRLLIWCMRLLGYSATSLPGVVALAICPDAVKHMGSSFEMVVAVTGTNGKTTTANLLAQLLRAAGYSVTHNTEGANMLNGIATALIRECGWWGKPLSQIALLEVDEGSVALVFEAIPPNLVVVTNYFRDQLDRYYEIDRTAANLLAAVKDIPGVQLVLNGDDPLVAAIGGNFGSVFYYGVAANQSAQLRRLSEESGREMAGEYQPETNETRERGYCSLCGGLLVYSYYHYGQLGDYHCSECSFQRPRLDFAAGAIQHLSPVRFTVDSRFFPAGRFECVGSLQGFYNVYNVLAAVAAATLLRVSDEVIRTALPEYHTARGRMEGFALGGRSCTLALIKNPAGLNEVIKTILGRPGEKSLVIAINDLAADGRDVSWLWDADFERLNQEGVDTIICSGRRAADMAVRLKYAGLPTQDIMVAAETADAINRLAEQPGDELYVLATYTNLFPCARLLMKAAESAPGKEPVRAEKAS